MSVAIAIENLSARIQDAYSALSAKGATMPVMKNTANLSATIDTIPEVVLEDKGVLTVNLSNDFVSSTRSISSFQTTILPGPGYNGILSTKVQYRLGKLILTPTTSQIVREISSAANLSTGYVGYKTVVVNPVTNTIDSNIQAGNIKNGVMILGVTGNLIPGITPTGNIQLTSTSQTDVTNYATAQVVDADLVAGNIKKDVNILGVTGTYEGSGGGGGGLQGYNLTLNVDGSCDGGVTIYHPDGTSGYLNCPANGTATASNVAYFEGYFASWDSNYCIYSGTYNVLLLADTTITQGTPCILKSSLVNLWNGTTKKIEDITYEDEILCWDFDNGKYASAKPFWIKKAQKNTFYWINKFESGKEIKTTGTVAGHRFFDIDKGKFLYNTECVGDLCYTKDGPDRLLEAKYVEGECEFYNIYTNYHMNLFANGILTGFRYNNLYPIKDMKFVKDGRVQRSREEFKSIPDSWFYGMRCSEQIDSVENITSYALSREMIKK